MMKTMLGLDAAHALLGSRLGSKLVKIRKQGSLIARALLVLEYARLPLMLLTLFLSQGDFNLRPPAFVVGGHFF